LPAVPAWCDSIPIPHSNSRCGGKSDLTTNDTDRHAREVDRFTRRWWRSRDRVSLTCLSRLPRIGVGAVSRS
jgi:hypothetical protein